MNLWEYAAAQPFETQQIQEVTADAFQFQREQDKRAKEQEWALDICRKYQENTRRSDEAQTAILKGLQSGENPYRLLITACECIGVLTDDPAFSDMVKSGIERTKGKGLQEPEVLENAREGIYLRPGVVSGPEEA